MIQSNFNECAFKHDGWILRQTQLSNPAVYHKLFTRLYIDVFFFTYYTACIVLYNNDTFPHQFHS